MTLPTRSVLEALFRQKHGDPGTWGWAIRRRFRAGYYTPDDVYEAMVARLVDAGCAWLDVGGGRDLFPSNRPLARALAGRCGVLVGVDPSDTIEENPFLHERVKAAIEDFRSPRTFDLVTLRMVAEHISDPEAAVASMARLVKPGGKVVVYTINRWSPVAVLAWITPFWVHHPLKSILWGTEEKDTFPVAYRMNTRRRLTGFFRANGFTERLFAYLDDCRTFHNVRVLNWLELSAWRLLKGFGLRYPENCLLGVYEKTSGAV
jgi:2-polyprenyl-3-methyl-5-hydroxy-6-metoxy-1,4-benzoquinol methylase